MPGPAQALIAHHMAEDDRRFNECRDPAHVDREDCMDATETVEVCGVEIEVWCTGMVALKIAEDAGGSEVELVYDTIEEAEQSLSSGLRAVRTLARMGRRA